MITLRDWFLGFGWTEGWAVAGAIVVALVAAALFAELFRAVGPALLSKIARPKRSWVAAFQKRRVFRSAAWVLIVLVTESQMTPLLEPWPKGLERTETFFAYLETGPVIDFAAFFRF
jgi:hypothetical protein